MIDGRDRVVSSTSGPRSRHLHLVEGVAKKEIARRLQLDIKTVRRAVAARGRSLFAEPRCSGNLAMSD